MSRIAAVTERSAQRTTTRTVIGALGIVYGDLGTSPLYSIREAFVGKSHRLAVDRANVLGAVSIIIWTLVVIIALKYVLLVLRADNDGEGGVLALTSLVDDSSRQAVPRRIGRGRRVRPGRRFGLVALLGLFGTALLIGDGMITPPISVLSAVEGLRVIRPGLDGVVVPLSVVILIALFSIQRLGSGLVGRVFGPIMTVWFVSIGALGAVSVARTPEILNALSPVYMVRYFSNNGAQGFLSIGSLFLVVTGGEALYADLGHFGRRAIRIGWFSAVMPALVLTYLGIGALLLRDSSAISSPFFLLAPSALHIPLVLLATMATVIASQALISGVNSLTFQAMQLGYAPRARIVHTSSTVRGQIYVPIVNWALMIACVTIVVTFRSSARLAAAFGLSVTGTMFITTILFALYARRCRGWSLGWVYLVATPLLIVEGAFLIANAFKIPEGGWLPLVVGVMVVTTLTTWKTGRTLAAAQVSKRGSSLTGFAGGLSQSNVMRFPGVAVYLQSDPVITPPSLLAIVRATGSLHEDVYVVSVHVTDAPRVPSLRRVDAIDLGHGIHRVSLTYGYLQKTTVADDLQGRLGLSTESTDYFLGRESVISTTRPGMARWRESLYALMARNAADVATQFGLPSDRVIEVGFRVEI